MRNPFIRNINVDHTDAFSHPVKCDIRRRVVLDKALCILLSLMLVLTMSPAVSVPALGAEDNTAASTSGGGGLTAISLLRATET